MNNSGYIAININGNQVGLKFGLPAIKQFSSFVSKVPFYDTLGDGTQTYSDLGLAHILYAGYTNNQYLKAGDIELSYEDFYNFVTDTIDSGKVGELIRPVIDCFEASKYVEPYLIKDEKTTKKKSGPGKK